MPPILGWGTGTMAGADLDGAPLARALLFLQRRGVPFLFEQR